jgi:hypothetical protein
MFGYRVERFLVGFPSLNRFVSKLGRASFGFARPASKSPASASSGVYRYDLAAVVPPGKGSIMSAISIIRLVSIAAATPLAVLATTGLAHADPPAPGDPCSVWHATTQDNSGRTMSCNHLMTGDHTLVWQYGGPAD